MKESKESKDAWDNMTAGGPLTRESLAKPRAKFHKQTQENVPAFTEREISRDESEIIIAEVAKCDPALAMGMLRSLCVHGEIILSPEDSERFDKLKAKWASGARSCSG